MALDDTNLIDIILINDLSLFSSFFSSFLCPFPFLSFVCFNDKQCGQMCASNVGNAFPVIWQDTMSILQDQVPAQSFETIRTIMEGDGMDMEKTFSDFERTPIGAASIGQVHRAVLRATGEPVVVKVCYPHVERLLKGDVRTIKLFARLAQPVHVPALEEVEVQFATEFDYRQEGRHLQEIADNLKRVGYAGTDAMCQIPRPFLRYCTKHVLVMSELGGKKLVTALREDLERQATRTGQSVEQLLQRQHSSLRQFEHDTNAPEAATHDGDSPRGPTAAQYQTWIALADSQRRFANWTSFVYNASFGWVTGQPKPYQDKSVLPLNHAKLIDDLLVIHGHEVLVDGVFNG